MSGDFIISHTIVFLRGAILTCPWQGFQEHHTKLQTISVAVSYVNVTPP